MTSDEVRWTKNDAADYGVRNIIGGSKFGHQKLNNNNKKLIRNNNNNNNCKNINTNTDSSMNKNNNNNQYYYNRDHRDNVKSFLIKMRSHFVSEILVIISILMRRNLIIAFCKLLAVFILFIQLSLLLSNHIFVIVAADNEWISNIDQNPYSSIERSTSLPDYDSHTTGHFTPTWAVHIPNGDTGLADRVAEDHGFINLGKIVDDHYHFHHNSVAKRSVGPSDHHQSRLLDDDRVRWSEQQRVKSRKKRDFIRMRPSRTSTQSMSLVNSIQLNDVKWPQMWYLNRGNGLDMNVIPAWKEGITGKGVVVTILDDGLESTHPDLEHNYDPKASYDVNSHDEDPMPHYDMTDSNRHGTRCAGEVAATANNTHCAVGIAFGASVGGVRMLDGDVTDAVEARSLSLNPQHIDIYSASWGPDDDGKTVDGPGEMATHAFIEGVSKGRNGKGSIFVWASGNGGRELDNCNCDGYTNSIWTLSISSATEEGHVPWYSEKCSSTLATTYSSGGQNEKQVVTTDLHHSCTASHTGTSASAPLAAGIVALVLEANQNLTWRDLQHIVVRTAKPGNLKDNTWSKNGVGRRVSHSFGYGLMDAAAMVRTARTWKTVPEQQRCEVNAPHMDKVILPKDHITLQLNVKHCTSVNFLEHVQAKITLTSQRRGDIQIYLKSPAGTKVTLLTSRIHDVSRSGFNQWPFMSVHTWGEAPHGNWQLEIHNEGRFMAQITQWDMIFYGTEQPAQPDDPYNVKVGRFGSYPSDMEHNLLDFDPETASGQWRNMQQVGESQVDVQRKSSNDLTKSSCLNMSPDQRCIECVQTTFLYDGRCFSSCPNQTYMVPEHPHSASFPTPEDSDDDGPLRRRRSLSNFYNLDDVLPQERAIMRPIPQKLCAACDSTCLRCRGPGIADCIKCHSGWTLVVLSADESYCKPSSITGNSLSRATNSLFGGSSSRSDGSYDDDEDGIGNDLYMFLIIIVPALTIIILVVIMSSFGKRAACPCSTRPNQAYDRIAFSAPDDDPDGDGDIEVHIGRFENIPDESIRNIPSGSGQSIKHPQLNARSNLISAEDSGSE